MIISFFAYNEPGVRGTINTGGDAPTATGVGEELLKTWMEQHKEMSPASAVESLEAFYASWGNQSGFSAVEPTGVDTTLSVLVEEPMALIQTGQGILNVRENGEWREATDADRDALRGPRIQVTEDILEDWDAGVIDNEAEAKFYKKGK